MASLQLFLNINLEKIRNTIYTLIPTGALKSLILKTHLNEMIVTVILKLSWKMDSIPAQIFLLSLTDI